MPFLQIGRVYHQIRKKYEIFKAGTISTYRDNHLRKLLTYEPYHFLKVASW